MYLKKTKHELIITMKKSMNVGEWVVNLYIMMTFMLKENTF